MSFAEGRACLIDQEFYHFFGSFLEFIGRAHKNALAFRGKRRTPRVLRPIRRVDGGAHVLLLRHEDARKWFLIRRIDDVGKRRGRHFDIFAADVRSGNHLTSWLRKSDSGLAEVATGSVEIAYCSCAILSWTATILPRGPRKVKQLVGQVGQGGSFRQDKLSEAGRHRKSLAARMQRQAFLGKRPVARESRLSRTGP